MNEEILEEPALEQDAEQDPELMPDPETGDDAEAGDDPEETLEPAQPGAAPVPLLRQPLPPSIAFSVCPTLGEFLDTQAGQPYLPLLRQRLAEVRLPVADQLFFVDYPDPLNMVAVVGLHLPDTPAVLPLWVRIAEACPRADLRVVTDEDGAALEALLRDESALDLEALELPALLLLDDEWRLQAHWGPRPRAAEPSIDEWLAHHPEYETLVEGEAEGTLSPERLRALAALHSQLMLQMRIWYNSGLDAEGSTELRALFASLLDGADSPA